MKNADPAVFIETVIERLLAGKVIRRRGPAGVRVQIERPVPILVVQRRTRQGADEGTAQLLAHAASAVFAPAKSPVGDLVRRVVEAASGMFGATLLLEVWAGPVPPKGESPRFRIVAPKSPQYIPDADRFQNELAVVRLAGLAAEVEVDRGAACAPPGMTPLITPSQARALKCAHFGLEIPAVYQDPETGAPYPVILRELRRDLTTAFRRWVHRFLCARTTLRPEGFHAIGARKVRKSVWEVDRQLAEIADSFDFLLQVTPTNGGEAWEAFKRSGHETEPIFQYRPITVEPTVLKRGLFNIPIERIDDPALYQLFREKQDELDRQITMLLDMNTPRFVHGSVQLYGPVDDKLVRICRDMLRRIPATTREKSGTGKPLDSRAFARRAEKELAYFREQWPEMKARVEVRPDISSGLMVSHGSLLIGQDTSIPAARVEALIQHEVGTHVLTYWNGRAQPFRQLYSGLAGYDPLQEGLAVLAEFFVGGLSGPRRRLLVARVVAARHMLDGASFVETFRQLHRTWGFAARTAFTITMRIYRGGGLTKDAVYVRGVGQLIDHLAAGGALEPLLLGKIATEHIPLVDELRQREVLVKPPLRPRYLDTAATAKALARLRAGTTLFQIVKSK